MSPVETNQSKQSMEIITLPIQPRPNTGEDRIFWLWFATMMENHAIINFSLQRISFNTPKISP